MIDERDQMVRENDQLHHFLPFSTIYLGRGF